jgi:hypothetical protein
MSHLNKYKENDWVLFKDKYRRCNVLRVGKLLSIKPSSYKREFDTCNILLPGATVPIIAMISQIQEVVICTQKRDGKLERNY